MKKTLIPLTLALLMARLTSAQSYLKDTIQVNRLTTTYLIFPEAVAVVDISPEYLVKIESGNIVFVRPRLTTARKTPFFVRTDRETYLGYLSVGGPTPSAFVEVKKYLPAKVVKPVPTEATALLKLNGPLLASLRPSLVGSVAGSDQPTAFQAQLDTMLRQSPNLHVTDSNSGISVELTHLVHDANHTFLQLTVSNRTQMPFLFDQVACWYEHRARKRKGAYLDGETYPMESIYAEVPARVEAGQSVRLRLVLHQYAPHDRSRFVLNIREKAGTRNVSLKVPMKAVLYATSKPLKHSDKSAQTVTTFTVPAPPLTVSYNGQQRQSGPP
ncbi:MAG: hypothetical protein JWP57_283 [Spirosoma sp.]|nr:hypothetical protein [Spirosoma sp.]